MKRHILIIERFNLECQIFSKKKGILKTKRIKKMNVVVCMKDSNPKEMMQKKEDLMDAGLCKSIYKGWNLCNI